MWSQTVLGALMMPMIFLSGAMFPVRGLPGWLAWLVSLNPLTYAVDAVRRTVAGHLPGTPAGPLLTGPSWAGWQPPVLVGLAAVALLGVTLLSVAARRFADATR
ncbi:hypothetical protein Misp01_46770 [Microtetraspora sp. NBRC 13810]|uniref:ABC transporter permease n=1 Tax=Microtetraspora sp. NBRC 13810 TaxID=3030990 RepID=UPI0024A18642|nr:ABC transporter permease [Microtetraspora sp. NBRC 13810]GLW09548.1 hypothetical protein Misp01_46770 [Microtetraspora sp. NBRC 13810]